VSFSKTGWPRLEVEELLDIATLGSEKCWNRTSNRTTAAFNYSQSLLQYLNNFSRLKA
jgi:hypothetical protein